MLGLALVVPMFVPTTGTLTVPAIPQQVRIGDAALIPDTGMTPPIALVHPQPEYTAQAIANAIDRTVTVRAEFDIEGGFRVLEVVESPGYGLEAAALGALEQWRFRPAYRSGRRVAVVANIEIEFRRPRTVAPVIRIAGDQTMSIDGRPIDILQLKESLEAQHADTVYLDADPTLPYSSVAHLIAVARTAGVQKIGLTTER